MSKFDFYDLFCGAGGTSQGVHLAKNDKGENICEVIACINHDATAILSHAENFPNTVHFTEDIRSFDTLKLKQLKQNRLHLGRKNVLWASLECTNFSKAKGGKPRDADSRTLAEHLFPYIDALQPEYIMIENVEEFMSWGEVDENGKPVSKKKGCDYWNWCNKICGYGYSYDYRLLNSADFGAHTSRVRYFGIFAKNGLKISFPSPTHTKKPINGNTLFEETLKAWNPVKDCLDFQNVGKSVFNRKKPLVDKTIRRILKGVEKYHNLPLLMTCNTPGYCSPLSQPSGTLTTAGHKALIVPFTMAYYGSENKNVNDINEPLRTITTKDRFGLVSAWIVNPQYSSNGTSVNKPCPVIIASQKSNPLSVATAIKNQDANKNLCINESDSDLMKELKVFCANNGISDIFMRMLTVQELKQIQGFSNDYVLKGSTVEQKKFIGNSVVPVMSKVLLEAIAV